MNFQRCKKTDETRLEVLEKNIQEIEAEVTKAKAVHEQFPDSGTLRAHYWGMQELLHKLRDKRDKILQGL